MGGYSIIADLQIVLFTYYYTTVLPVLVSLLRSGRLWVILGGQPIASVMQSLHRTHSTGIVVSHAAVAPHKVLIFRPPPYFRGLSANSRRCVVIAVVVSQTTHLGDMAGTGATKLVHKDFQYLSTRVHHNDSPCILRPLYVSPIHTTGSLTQLWLALLASNFSFSIAH